jgi:hypothetical protein
MNRRLKVKIGSHYDESGKEWVAGQVFEGPARLLEVFPEKFEDLGEAGAKKTQEPVLVQNEPESPPESQEEPAAEAKPPKKPGRKPAIPLNEDDWDKP